MKNKIVRKSNILIEASYKLSTQEQRVIMFLVSLIKPEDEDFKNYSISVKDFSDLVGVHHKGNYQDIKEITKKLISRVFTIKSPGEELQISWLSSAKYIAGKGTVSLSFDQNLKPFLLQLKNRFTKYNLYEVMQLKSSFSIRIYELLKQYQKLGERVFDVEQLRENLGIEKEQYKNFNDFKRYVILVAQEELAKKTDVSFDFEEIKTGRCVGKIRFFIKVKPQSMEILANPKTVSVVTATHKMSPQINDVLLKLIDLLPEDYREKESVRKLLKTWLEKRDFDYVARNIEYANDCSNAVNPGVNVAKGSNYRNYLAKTLVGDFGLPYKEDLEVKRKEEEEVKQKAQEETAAKKQKIEQARHEKENIERVRVFLGNLTAEGKEQLRAEAISCMDPQQQENVKRKGFGYEIMLRFMMEKISLERMKIS